MAHEEVVTIIQELWRATDELAVAAHPRRFDLNGLERALAHRMGAVERLSRMVESFPQAFTGDDLQEIRVSQSRGKRALEALLAWRRNGWDTATQLSRNQYVIGTISTTGCTTWKRL
jgi:hypothetical protein